MQFKIVLDFNPTAKGPPDGGVPTSPEIEFLRLMAKFTPPRRKEDDPLAINPYYRLFRTLPRILHHSLQERLTSVYYSEPLGSGRRIVFRPQQTDESAFDYKRILEEESRRLDRAMGGMTISVKECRFGSLEIVLLILGLAGVTRAIGISTDEFKEYLELLVPEGVNRTFEAEAPLEVVESQIMGSDGAETPAGDKPTNPTDLPIPKSRGKRGAVFENLLAQGSPYLFPAVVTIAVLWLVSAAFHDMQAAVADQQKQLVNSLHEETMAIAQERANLTNLFLGIVRDQNSAATGERNLIADKVTAAANTLMSTTQAKDAVRDQAYKTMIDDQAAIIRDVYRDRKQETP